MAKVNLIGFKELQRKIAKAPDVLKQEIGAEVHGAAFEFQQLAFKDAPADVGTLKSQITFKPTGELSAEVVSGSEYSAPMEFGTKGNFRAIEGIDSAPFKGQPSGGTWQEFIQNIKNWTKRKGIDAPPYVIAQSIIKKGVKPHPFFFKQIAPVKKELVGRIENILKDVFK